MAACAMQTFNNVTSSAWNCLKSALADHGIVVDSDSGSADAHGVYASWKYTAATNTLQVQVTKITNIFVSCSAANGYVHDAVQKCYANHDLVASKIIEVD